MCCESDQPSLTQAGHRRGQIQLLAALSAIVLVWCGLLPALGRTTVLRQRIAFLEARGVNPSAKFFTEQEAGWRNAAEVERQLQEHPQAFWALPWRHR